MSIQTISNRLVIKDNKNVIEVHDIQKFSFIFYSYVLVSYSKGVNKTTPRLNLKFVVRLTIHNLSDGAWLRIINWL